MIDTHCHLDHSEFTSDALEDLRAAVTIGIDETSAQNAIALANNDERIFAAVGIHPGNADHARNEYTRKAIENMLDQKRVVGVGETGFDTYWDRQTLADQQFSYDWQAELAHARNMPLILHIRSRPEQLGNENATVIARAMLEQYPGNLVILHCFNGDPDLLDLAIERDFYVSFAGNLTYPSATDLHEAARKVPRELLLVETDAPYLAPVPQRGKRNKPAWVHHTAKFLADLREEPIEQLEPTLDANAIRVFSLPLGGGQ